MKPKTYIYKLTTHATNYLTGEPFFTSFAKAKKHAEKKCGSKLVWSKLSRHYIWEAELPDHHFTICRIPLH